MTIIDSHPYRVIGYQTAESAARMLHDDRVTGASEAWIRVRAIGLDPDVAMIRILDLEDDSIGMEWRRDPGFVVFPPQLRGMKLAPFTAQLAPASSAPEVKN